MLCAWPAVDEGRQVAASEKVLRCHRGRASRARCERPRPAGSSATPATLFPETLCLLALQLLGSPFLIAPDMQAAMQAHWSAKGKERRLPFEALHRQRMQEHTSLA